MFVCLFVIPLTEDQPPTRQPFVLSGSRTISRSAFLNGNVFTNVIAWRHLQPVLPPSPLPLSSFFFFVFFSSPCAGLSHGGSVALGMLRCLLTPSKWTSSVIILGFLAALSSFSGNSFFLFSTDGGDRGWGQHNDTLRVTRKTDTYTPGNHRQALKEDRSLDTGHARLLFVESLQTEQAAAKFGLHAATVHQLWKLTFETRS